MAYDYDPPLSDIFSFIIFTVVVTTVGLTINQSRDFRNSLKYEHLTTTCLAFAVYIFPAIICLRVARKEALGGPLVPKILLFTEFGICVGNLFLTIVCWRLKHVPQLTEKVGLGNIHHWINKETYYEACERHKKAHTEINKRHFLRYHPSLWWFAMVYFFVRHMWIYWVHIPICIGINLYIAVKYHPPVLDFDPLVFWVVLGIVLIAITTWFWLNICFIQAYIYFILILNSVFTCYFIADSEYLTNLLLAALTIELSSAYDLINDENVTKIYNIPSMWLFQMDVWRSKYPQNYVAPWEVEEIKIRKAKEKAGEEIETGELDPYGPRVLRRTRMSPRPKGDDLSEGPESEEEESSVGPQNLGRRYRSSRREGHDLSRGGPVSRKEERLARRQQPRREKLSRRPEADDV
jgi:hypothetical protein